MFTFGPFFSKSCGLSWWVYRAFSASKHTCSLTFCHGMPNSLARSLIPAVSQYFDFWTTFPHPRTCCRSHAGADKSRQGALYTRVRGGDRSSPMERLAGACFQPRMCDLPFGGTSPECQSDCQSFGFTLSHSDLPDDVPYVH